MTLGQRIQQIRIEHSLSQQEFAEKLGTTRQTVSRWELDQTYPEIAKIVLISKVFSVTTDSILREGISTFESDVEFFNCGVYRSKDCEIAETEKFSLVLCRSSDKNIICAKLYYGYENKKNMVAICERNIREDKTEFAYLPSGCDVSMAVANSDRLVSRLSENYDPEQKRGFWLAETFETDHSAEPLPTVKKAGIPKCLELWRMGDSFTSDRDCMRFLLCTGKTEYVFSIDRADTNIYCGASYNTVFDLGLFSGGQYFRIRNYRDNSEKWCGFFCDFSYMPPEAKVPTDQCELGKCVRTPSGMMWCVKRYTDDEIVLQGCGDDEYVYRRREEKTERFVSKPME